MNRIITLGRESGSGGRELAKLLASQLDLAYYDKEILTEICKKTDLAQEYVKHVLDKPGFYLPPIPQGYNGGYHDDYALKQRRDIYQAQHEAIRDIAARGNCLIVGRCADYILRDQHPVRLFVHASLEARIERFRANGHEGEDLSDKALRQRIRRLDKDRAAYYSFYTGLKWGWKDNYDLTINTTSVIVSEVAPALAAMLDVWFDHHDQ